MNRRFPVDPLDERSSAGSYDDAKILVLSSPEDTRADALRVGQVLSRILLECTAAGLATCPVTHVTELEAGRDLIRHLMADPAAVPHVLIRVGVEPEGVAAPPDAAATARRRLAIPAAVRSLKPLPGPCLRGQRAAQPIS